MFKYPINKQVLKINILAEIYKYLPLSLITLTLGNKTITTRDDFVTANCPGEKSRIKNGEMNNDLCRKFFLRSG
ncbi:hypothetical protein GCM10026986_28100 [Nitrincola alkalisediminis]